MLKILQHLYHFALISFLLWISVNQVQSWAFKLRLWTLLGLFKSMDVSLFSIKNFFMKNQNQCYFCQIFNFLFMRFKKMPCSFVLPLTILESHRIAHTEGAPLYIWWKERPKSDTDPGTLTKFVKNRICCHKY